MKSIKIFALLCLSLLFIPNYALSYMPINLEDYNYDTIYIGFGEMSVTDDNYTLTFYNEPDNTIHTITGKTDEEFYTQYTQSASFIKGTAPEHVVYLNMAVLLYKGEPVASTISEVSAYYVKSVTENENSDLVYCLYFDDPNNCQQFVRPYSDALKNVILTLSENTPKEGELLIFNHTFLDQFLTPAKGISTSF